MQIKQISKESKVQKMRTWSETEGEKENIKGGTTRNFRVVQDGVKTNNDNKIVLYTDERGNVELRADVSEETLWATQNDIARIFDGSKQTVSRHILRIFKEGELKQESVVKEYLTTADDGKKYLTNCYNLDVIIAVGYRVNSKKATQFRIWATSILREYILQGYSLNNYRLDQNPYSFKDLQKTLLFIEEESKKGNMKGKVTVRFSKNIEKTTNEDL